MRGNINRSESSTDDYRFRSFEAEKKRLNLNDLLNRAKEEKKIDKKYNALIFLGAVCLCVTFYLLITL